MSYEKTTISKIIEMVDRKNIYLPAIQRKYVWSENQIIKLMDSIMRGYPFGTFLFWKVKKKTINDKGYSMYEFIKDYHERDNYKNAVAGLPFDISSTNPDETVLSALDGQQRLTSLYIVLKGSSSRKIPRKHKKNDAAYPKKQLYLDLKSSAKLDEELAYNFAFLTKEEVDEKNTRAEEFWFLVKDVIGFSGLEEIQIWFAKTKSSEISILTNLTRLFNCIKTTELINYFEVETDSIDDVLDIFVRVNSGGTVLSKTDLLFSTIVSFWDKGRDEIDDLLTAINRIGEHYSFTNDFIMRTCLYMAGVSTALKVETFGEKNVKVIKDNWSNIKEAIKETIKFLSDLGFSEENIIADTAILPVAYYRYKFGSNKAFKVEKNDTFDVRMELRKYFVAAQMKHIFGQSTNSTLDSIRKELNKHDDKFRLDKLKGLSFSGGANLKCTEEDIEEWLDTHEKNAYTFMLLSLLYPNLKYGEKRFHQDHMHPYSAFEDMENLKKIKLPNGKALDEDKILLWKHQRNTLANLQLLEEIENESKNDTPLFKWVSEYKGTVEYLPQNISYELNNFEDFIEKRKELMKDKLKNILL